MHNLGKILWFFATPSNALLLLALFATFRALMRGSRVWSGLAMLILLGLGTAGLSPLPNWATLPLETRFPVWKPAEGAPPPAGIIVLGGAADADATFGRGAGLELNEAGDRVMAMLALARRFPEARIVFTGGAGELIGSGNPEADAVKARIADYGLDPGRVQFENRSRNTHENALYTRDLVMPKPEETWLLVTSAFHMPRSMGVFRQAGFKVAPYPVDFRTAGPESAEAPFGSLAAGLARLDMAVKEWIGLAAYRAMGRTDALFPAP
ncbi:YdcF family protein [Rhabdaerophilum calidifontis]|uniref:YdcF family protein n=1 Tax=Rhabdaerophilum calidifontis TaxID=2604328 RepID=UPI001FE81F8E|nr:YdcF family protein [Rhabdaerophilum calidifontis]